MEKIESTVMTQGEFYAFKCGVYEGVLADIKMLIHGWKHSILGDKVLARINNADEAIKEVEAEMEKEAGK